MKSLEIVNNTIVKQQTIEVKGNDRLPSIFVDDIRIAGVKWNDSPDANYISTKLNTHSKVISVENLEQIKQDLEVLEILRKYIIIEEQCFDYDLEDGGTWIDYLNLKDINLNDIDDIDPHWRDDLKKVKQWLEENEK